MPGNVTPGHRQVDWRDSVRFATAAALPAHTGTGTATLTASANGALAMDGGAPVAGDRVLVKDQAGALAIDNLVWVVRQPGTADPGGTRWILDRAADGDTSEEVTYGFTVRVMAGATQADSGWSITTNDPITLGTTAVAWAASPAGAGFAAAGALSGIEAGDAAAAGTALTVPRGDHQHAVSTAAPAVAGLDAASAVGVATSLARSDHRHQSNTAPAAVTKAAAIIGVSQEPARADHKHDASTAAPGVAGVAAASGEGAATSLARSDHVHQSNTAATTIASGDAAAVGTSGEPARADHRHGAPGSVFPVLNRQTLAADSTLTGDVILAGVETAHTPITLTAALLGTARRTIPFRAMLNPASDNGADTWRTRVRLGAAGVGGVLLIDSTAFNSVANQGLYVEGTIQILTTGAPGTFASYCRLVNEATGAEIHSFVASGALDTTVNRDLTVSGESSSVNANQQMTLRHFEAEVMAA